MGVPKEGKIGIKFLLQFESFFLVYNLPSDGGQALSDVKNMIHKLYSSLNVEKHQVIH